MIDERAHYRQSLLLYIVGVASAAVWGAVSRNVFVAMVTLALATAPLPPTDRPVWLKVAGVMIVGAVVWGVATLFKV